MLEEIERKIKKRLCTPTPMLNKAYLKKGTKQIKKNKRIEEEILIQR
jgi:hypothetical protein